MWAVGKVMPSGGGVAVADVCELAPRLLRGQAITKVTPGWSHGGTAAPYVERRALFNREAAPPIFPRGQ